MKIKTQKGITLVALVITIIVLLILAAVAIGAIQNKGIIKYAQNASADYEAAEKQEQSVLASLLDKIKEKAPGNSGEGNEENAGTGDENQGSDENAGDNSGSGENNGDGSSSGNEGDSDEEEIISWTDNGNGTFSKGEITVKIGDYVNYNEGSSTHTPDTAKGAGTSETGWDSSTGYTLGTSELATEDLSWRVLGLNEEGQIELISADPTTQTLYLANDEGYINAEDNLNNFCNDLYGQGTDVEGNKLATGARSLKVEDIDNLTNYDKTTYSGYGNKWTYRYPTQEEMDAFTGTENSTRYMQYRTDKPDGTQVIDWTNITSSYYQTFRLPDETTLINSENLGSKEVEWTCYIYGIASNLTVDDGFTSDEAIAISNMICKGTSSSDIKQWLASCCVSCDSSGAHFSVRFVGLGFTDLFVSSGFYGCGGYHVRPVVSLKSDISLSGSGDSIGTVDNMWQIS